MFRSLYFYKPSRFLSILAAISGISLLAFILKNERNAESFNFRNNDKNYPSFLNNKFKNGEYDISKTLFSAVKILCIINSSKKEIFNRAIHVNATWAKRCNKHVFLTFQEDVDLPFLDLNITEIRKELWNKIRAALTWVHDNELENFDFFLRADDDSYFIMENLRFMLLSYNPKEALYFGARFKIGPPKGFMSGGAGVVLTREAIRKLVPAFKNDTLCSQTTSDRDDWELGVCAQNLNITFVDTRDHLGRHRMLPYAPANHFSKGLDSLQLYYLYYPYKQNNLCQTLDCISVNMISFHYLYNDTMYAFEFLIYHFKVFGAINDLFEKNDLGLNSHQLIEKLTQISINYNLK